MTAEELQEWTQTAQRARINLEVARAFARRIRTALHMPLDSSLDDIARAVELLVERAR